ncbi:receptor-type tyrosine-protein kinase FLT3 [Silurus asotus]|uniref:receptor protein-tyrosine kinase n=1 Tax=Silurus asotus TaxID=30991 RepID=A0AAD5B2V9_SILAS|nr:receptor-type tyrosine-protein kinase FLT3 [Silurus asotus]
MLLRRNMLLMGRPSVPQLTVSSGTDQTASFECVSAGNPKPNIMCHGTQEINLTEKVSKSKLDSVRADNNPSLNNNIKCCATNLHGEECSYIYNYVSVNDSGEYHCREKHGQTKTVKVQVFENDFLELLELNKSITIQDKDIANFCIQSKVHSNPKAQCQWITPKGSIVQCMETRYFSGESIFKMCNPEPGQYQIQLKAGKKIVTENMSICITDTPKFQLIQNLSRITCKIKGVLPVRVSWKTYPSVSNFSVWKETLADTPEYSDSKQFCHKDIVVSRPLSDVNNQFVQCCCSYNTGSVCSEKTLVKMPSENSFYLVVACSLLSFAFMLVSVLLFHFMCKKKPGYETQIQMIQMVGPSDNDYIYIDFKDFEYNQKLEFPRENLELGKELGSGAFGMVVQATAYGISKPGVSMQVAVKMLKEKHQAVEKEALMSELKMLSYIGHHINIVNLLGACTGTGPIYLIFQFCRYGDLLNYLRNNREHFYKSLTDAFNKDRFSSLYNNYQRKRNCSDFVQSGENSYMPMSPVNKEHEALLSYMDINEDIFENEDDEDLQTLTYEDLLSFSYQVAKGMEFLSSKNCLHRDLAARNILVTQGGLVKIGDFGLARDIENDSNYVVRGNARLPVKWMAPESIFKGMYTMQSDVWAYGILLWEIFSLGVTPYPGIKVDNTFYAMIDRGFHMERPYYASESVYKVMCHCWALEPKARPSFSKLLDFMECQLSDVEERLYYNVKRQKNGDSVYKNAPVTPKPHEPVEEDVHQSSFTDSSCDSETTQSEDNIEITAL